MFVKHKNKEFRGFVYVDGTRVRFNAGVADVSENIAKKFNALDIADVSEPVKAEEPKEAKKAKKAK